MTGWGQHLSCWTPELETQLRALEAERETEAYLVSEGLATEEEILRAKSRHFRLPYLTLSGYQPALEALKMITEEQARKLGIFPLFRLHERIFVAMPDPYDLRCEDFVRKLTGLRVKPVLASERDIRQAITRKYLASQIVSAGLQGGGAAAKDAKDSAAGEPVEDINESQSPAVKSVNRIIAQAIRLEASDIHLEPDQHSVFLRYRVDGVLHEYPPPDQSLYASVVSRIKIMSSLDIAEKRLPQDGRSSVEVDGKAYDLRVSVLPNIHGEGICIRILNPESAKMRLDQMGFEADTLERYDRVIRRPYGIVLVTGPTGSGKSTTLYATLQRIMSREVKIITLEDPVEYKVPGLVQVPVRPGIGYGFDVGLKAILRHDPDIVMLGEIRDLSSAEIAFRAALTGHLLFSTLHTNNASLAVTRLVDMGVPPFQVMAALSGILAQRLLRKLCLKCRQPVTLSPSELGLVGLSPEQAGRGQVYAPVGCADCAQIGYRGRTAIHEFLEITPDIKALPPERLDQASIEEIGRLRPGYRTLRESAIAKMLTGVTSLAEVVAVTIDA